MYASMMTVLMHNLHKCTLQILESIGAPPGLQKQIPQLMNVGGESVQKADLSVNVAPQHSTHQPSEGSERHSYTERHPYFPSTDEMVDRWQGRPRRSSAPRLGSYQELFFALP